MRSTGLLTGLLVVFASMVLEAQMSASQTVTINFVPVSYAAPTPASVAPEMSGAPGLLAGSAWRFVTTERGQKVVIDLDRPLPAGARLARWMPASGASRTAAATVADTLPMDLVTEIRPAHATTLPVPFIMRTSHAWGEVPAQRRLTYTMIAGA